MGCTTSREQVQSPWALSPLSNRHEWLRWKKCFRIYMDHKGIPHCKRGEKFLKYIGLFGKEISEKLYFANTAQETKYEVLLFKFDVYFMFSTNGILTKADNQNLEDYVAFLKNIAEKMDNKREGSVKEKILQDFKLKNLFHRLKRLDLDSRIPNYENLSMHELLFLWKECDHLESIRANNFCRFCGRQHPSGRCFAVNKKCWKCGGVNHYARCCKKSVAKCNFCGSSHERDIKMCPAFTKECSRCKRLNHFSWMCNTEMIANCIYCGGSHRSGRNYCSAGHSTCMTCSKKGHYTSQCYHRRR